MQGCCTAVRSAEGEQTQPRLLPIDPTLTYRVYTCPCPRRALLDVGQNARKEWVLREHTLTRDEREEINLIAQALIAGQAHQDQVAFRPTLTAPDLHSDRMVSAFMAAHQLSLQVVKQVLAGNTQVAQDLALRANAADHAYQSHARVLRRDNRAQQQTGRYKNAKLFWLDLPVRHGDQDRLVAVPRFTFAFLGVYNEEERRYRVENSADIERASGLEVGEDGWRQLMDLLTRFEVKPDQKENPAEPIWFDDRGTLTLRRHIRLRFPRALVALEALRRTLTPALMRRPKQEDESYWRSYALHDPLWVYDALGTDPDRQRPNNRVHSTYYPLLVPSACDYTGVSFGSQI